MLYIAIAWVISFQVDLCISQPLTLLRPKLIVTFFAVKNPIDLVLVVLRIILTVERVLYFCLLEKSMCVDVEQFTGLKMLHWFFFPAILQCPSLLSLLHYILELILDVH